MSTTLSRMSAAAAAGGIEAVMSCLPAMRRMMALVGMSSSSAMPIPISPAIRPVMNVSALKISPTLRLEAPMARRIPISFLRSSTLMCVMTPIMIDDTMSEIATNAMRTQLITLTILVTEAIIVPTISVYVTVFSSWPDSFICEL